jgi:hypothetical protein
MSVTLAVLALLPACALAQAGLCTWCPHVVPTWPASWAMRDSTIAMPCNSSGLLRPEVLANFSISSIDWSSSKSAWVRGRPMDAETPLLQQAQLNHAANPAARTFIYKNVVIAYPWFPLIRAKLLDPQFADWFIPFGAPPFANGSFNVPNCDHNFDPPLCSKFYHSQDQTPGYPTGDGVCPAPACDCGGVPCGFYLFKCVRMCAPPFLAPPPSLPLRTRCTHPHLPPIHTHTQHFHPPVTQMTP